MTSNPPQEGDTCFGEPTSPKCSPQLLAELWVQVLANLEYFDLLRASQVCRQFNCIIKGDKYGEISKTLFRNVQDFEVETQRYKKKQQIQKEADDSNAWHFFTLNPRISLLQVKTTLDLYNRGAMVGIQDVGFMQNDGYFKLVKDTPAGNENAFKHYATSKTHRDAPPAQYFIQLEEDDADISSLNNITISSFLQSIFTDEYSSRYYHHKLDSSPDALGANMPQLMGSHVCYNDLIKLRPLRWGCSSLTPRIIPNSSGGGYAKVVQDTDGRRIAYVTSSNNVGFQRDEASKEVRGKIIYSVGPVYLD